MHRVSALALCFIFALVLGVQSIGAQSTNGSFAGRIIDPSQTRIAGARVVAINTGFDAVQTDVALQRVFRVAEKARLQFRGEFFNIFNHPNSGSPANSLTSALFGRSTQTLANSLGAGGANGGFYPLYQIGGPRSIQLAAKLPF